MNSIKNSIIELIRKGVPVMLAGEPRTRSPEPKSLEPWLANLFRDVVLPLLLLILGFARTHISTH